MIDINLSGVWKSVKAAVPHIINGGRGGSIILTSSVGGLKAYPHCGNYVSAKHGVVGLMRGFAVELGHHNIRANTVHPTHVNTDMLHNEGTFKMFRPDLRTRALTIWRRSARCSTPCRSRGSTPDISNAVLFLASDEARYITGVTLPVDAGSCLK